MCDPDTWHEVAGVEVLHVNIDDRHALEAFQLAEVR